MKQNFASFLCFAVALSCTSFAMAEDISVTNSTPIEWGTAGTGQVTSGPATLFPSTVDVATLDPFVTSATVSLNTTEDSPDGHTFIDDLEVTLVAPDGTALNVLLNAGGAAEIAGTLTFDDSGSFSAISDFTTDPTYGPGTFASSAYGSQDGGNLAPEATIADLTGFNGLDANGTWSLYVYDGAGGDTGVFDGGWTLNLGTTAVPEPTTFALFGIAMATMVRRRRS